MIRTSQNAAFTPAHAQPSASSRPKNARLRGTIPPGPSACWAIAQPAVRVPVMFECTVHMNVYVPAGSAGTW